MSGRLVLASASPRRAMLLGALGISFDIKPVDVDETIGHKLAKKPAEYVLSMSRLKARTALEAENKGLEGGWILAADTIVVLDSMILGKPRDVKQAEEYLISLSGREHYVYSAFTLLEKSTGKEISKKVKTSVKMKKLSDQEIGGYIKSGEPLDKAGGYAAQGIGSFMIESIKGSYTNVVGLPMAELVDELVNNGIACPFENAQG